MIEDNTLALLWYRRIAAATNKLKPTKWPSAESSTLNLMAVITFSDLSMPRNNRLALPFLNRFEHNTRSVFRSPN